MDKTTDNKQTTEARNETKDDDKNENQEEKSTKNQDKADDNTPRAAAISTKGRDKTNETDREEDAEDGDDEDEYIDEDEDEDEDEDDEDSLHIVSSVREFRRPPAFITLEGTHTAATETESLPSVATREEQALISFEEITEEICMAATSTSKVVENMREYAREIDGNCAERSNLSPPTAENVGGERKLKQARILETIKDVNELSVTSQLSGGDNDVVVQEAGGALALRSADEHDEVEVIIAANVAPRETLHTAEQSDFQRVQRENEEIAVRFQKIMEMFDSFTKNLESFEMPTIRPLEEAQKKVLPPRRQLSFKGIGDEQRNTAASGAGFGGSEATATGDVMYNEFCKELNGERKRDEKDSQILNSSTMSECIELRPMKTEEEAALQHMHRDMATTVSGLDLLSAVAVPSPRSARNAQNLNTIGCQTVKLADHFSAYCACSTSISNLVNLAPKDYAQTDAGEENIMTALTIDTIATEPTTRTCANAPINTQSFTNETSVSTTIVQPMAKIDGTNAQQSPKLLKKHEPPPSPTIVDLEHSAIVAPPVITSVVRDANATADAPCERSTNFHTIQIEANAISPSSSVMRRPHLCAHLWNVITDFCAAVCVCLQVNKDCLFCLGFFVAFIVSASFLTAFFFRMLNMSPHMMQAANLAKHHAETVQ